MLCAGGTEGPLSVGPWWLTIRSLTAIKPGQDPARRNVTNFRLAGGAQDGAEGRRLVDTGLGRPRLPELSRRSPLTMLSGTELFQLSCVRVMTAVRASEHREQATGSVRPSVPLWQTSWCCPWLQRPSAHTVNGAPARFRGSSAPTSLSSAQDTRACMPPGGTVSPAADQLSRRALPRSRGLLEGHREDPVHQSRMQSRLLPPLQLQSVLPLGFAGCGCRGATDGSRMIAPCQGKSQWSAKESLPSSNSL